MAVIGLLGGVACGKSAVAEILHSLGAVVLDADRAGHHVLTLPHIKAAIRSVWGAAVFIPSGEVDRQALGKIVFARMPQAKADLSQLEQITHPEIGRQILKEISLKMRQQRIPAIVLDAPVMLKAGWNRYCDWILFVDVPRELRQQRAMSRGWSAEEFSAREAVQESLETKRQFSNVVIDNSGSLAAARMQIEKFWHAHIAPPDRG